MVDLGHLGFVLEYGFKNLIFCFLTLVTKNEHFERNLIPLLYQRFFSQHRPKWGFRYPRVLSADGRGGCVLLPWVARPNRHLSFEEAFVQGPFTQGYSRSTHFGVAICPVYITPRFRKLHRGLLRLTHFVVLTVKGFWNAFEI